MSVPPPVANCLKTVALFLSLMSPTFAADWQHGLSLFGEPELPRGFAHFPRQ